MSIWNHIFDSEWRQRSDIEELKRAGRRRRRQSSRRLSRAKQSIEECEQRIEQLEDEVGDLELLCRSLVHVLQNAQVLLPGEMEKAMRRIDAEDGVIDGKITKPEDRPGDDPAP